MPRSYGILYYFFGFFDADLAAEELGEKQVAEFSEGAGFRNKGIPHPSACLDFGFKGTNYTPKRLCESQVPE